MSQNQQVTFSTTAAQQVSDNITDLLRQSHDQAMHHLQQMQNIVDSEVSPLPHWHEQASTFVAGTRSRYMRVIRMYQQHILAHLADQIAAYTQAEAALRDDLPNEQ